MSYAADTALESWSHRATDGLARAAGELDGTSERVAAVVGALEAVRVAAVDALVTWDAEARWGWDGARSPEAWLAHECRMRRADAKATVAVARLCRNVPAAHDALQGRLVVPGADPESPAVTIGASFAQLLIWARVVTGPRLALFVEHAAGCLAACAGMNEWSTTWVANRWARMADDHLGLGGDDDGFARRGANLARHGDGTGRLTVDLDTHALELVSAMFDSMDRPDPDDHPGGPRTRAQRYHDHLAEVARRHLAGLDHPEPDRIGAPTQTVLTIVQVGEPGGTTSEGTPVPAALVEQYECTGLRAELVVDPHGEPLALGRTRRLFTGAQTRAVIARDRHCQFPGCDAPPSRCETHHVTHWQHGGPTDVANAALVCHFHHRLLHNRRWALTANPDRARSPGQPRWLLDRDPAWARGPRPVHPPGAPPGELLGRTQPRPGPASPGVHRAA